MPRQPYFYFAVLISICNFAQLYIDIIVELITNIIVEYLKHNKHIVVPKLGSFIVKQSSGAVLFSELMRNDDGVLCSLLKAYGMSELEANGAIDRFVFDIRFNTGKGESFTIENFGVFAPGDNNTITFRQKREPQTFGGSVKPPVEMLAGEKRKMQRRRAEDDAHDTTATSTKHTEHHTASQRTRPHDEQMSLTTPDRYLRGLKYDKTKNAKREESMFSSGSRSQKNASRTLLIMALAAIVVASAGWFAWQSMSKHNGATSNTVLPAEQPVKSADSTQLSPELLLSVDVDNTATAISGDRAEAEAEAVSAQGGTSATTAPSETSATNSDNTNAKSITR